MVDKVVLWRQWKEIIHFICCHYYKCKINWITSVDAALAIAQNLKQLEIIWIVITFIHLKKRQTLNNEPFEGFKTFN